MCKKCAMTAMIQECAMTLTTQVTINVLARDLFLQKSGRLQPVFSYSQLRLSSYACFADKEEYWISKIIIKNFSQIKLIIYSIPDHWKINKKFNLAIFNGVPLRHTANFDENWLIYKSRIIWNSNNRVLNSSTTYSSILTKFSKNKLTPKS